MGIQYSGISKLAVDIEIPTGSRRHGKMKYERLYDFFQEFIPGKKNFVFFRMHSIKLELVAAERVKWYLDFSGGSTLYFQQNCKRYNLVLDLSVTLYDSVWYLANQAYIMLPENNVKISINSVSVVGLLRSIATIRNYALYSQLQKDADNFMRLALPKIFRQWGFPLDSGERMIAVGDGAKS